MIRRLIALTLLCLPVLAQAAGEREKARLESLRGQRAALERELKKKEAARAAAAEQLRRLEKAIAESERKLRELAEERAAARTALASHEHALRRLETQTTSRREQLATLLRRQFQPHGRDALSLWLAGEKPDEVARERHFLTLLAHAQAKRIGQLREDVAAIRRQAELVRTHQARLAELARSEAAERAALQQRQKERQRLLTRLSGEIETKRRTIETLKQDERRLARVLAALEKKKAAGARAAPNVRAGKSEDAARSSMKDAEPIAASAAFAKLRGRLPWPVKGQVVARFGTRRDEGELSWKGMFIRAAEGSEVRAVADGVVVFADWLRGYGNLLIIDHDDGFLSIYGNNQTLLAEVGHRVVANKPVATVGNSGGQQETGLYFELRYKGQAIDPGNWFAGQ